MNKRALTWGRLAAHDLEAVQKAAQLPAAGEDAPAQTLGEKIERRVAFLTDYQNATYAERYRERVDQVAAVERERVPGSTRFAEAVASYYFKLLAYKDEYEVARLLSDGAFAAQIASEFEGDYKLTFHLAPQILFPADRETGRVRKISIPGWALPVFRLLAKLKFLRGTRLDPFGQLIPHRKLERQLIRDYEERIAELSANLSSQNLDLAVEIASIPEHIRGFGVVKEQSIDEARAREAQLVASFQDHSSA
jgi:indolepyruvate ferredoxin oxidoreductase